jgi:hypothetical protein
MEDSQSLVKPTSSIEKESFMIFRIAVIVVATLLILVSPPEAGVVVGILTFIWLGYIVVKALRRRAEADEEEKRNSAEVMPGISPPAGKTLGANYLDPKSKMHWFIRDTAASAMHAKPVMWAIGIDVNFVTSKYPYEQGFSRRLVAECRLASGGCGQYDLAWKDTGMRLSFDRSGGIFLDKDRRHVTGCSMLALLADGTMYGLDPRYK